MTQTWEVVSSTPSSLEVGQVPGVHTAQPLQDTSECERHPSFHPRLDVEFHYGYYPESIVTASTSWLGDDFDSALLNGALVEAIRFLKGEADMVALYQKMYMEAITLLGALGDNKLREDAYRSGQYRMNIA